MTRTTVLALCLTLLASAPTAPGWAQTPPALPGPGTPPDAAAPPDPPGHERAVIGGKRLQPHSEPGQAGQSPEAQIRLLQQGAKDPAATEPVVVPRDLYGNPLGGNPGLNPPGLEPPPSTAPAPTPHKS
jgi:hypothetical protein